MRALLGCYLVGSVVTYALGRTVYYRGLRKGQDEVVVWMNVNAGTPPVTDAERANRRRYGLPEVP